jgi:hypothetical protein
MVSDVVKEITEENVIQAFIGIVKLGIEECLNHFRSVVGGNTLYLV